MENLNEHQFNELSKYDLLTLNGGDHLTQWFFYTVGQTVQMISDGFAAANRGGGTHPVGW